MDINVLSEEELSSFNKLIDDAERIIVLGHKSPDGDAMGACLGFAEYLKTQRQKSPMVIMPDAYPDFLQWLPDTEKVVRYDKHGAEVEDAFQKADLIFCIDFNEASRVENLEPVLTASKAHKVMIDHHLNPFMENLDMLVSDSAMSSASEVVFRIIWQLGGFEKLTKKGAMQIYCGMMTDTGGFTFNSSRPEIYFIIGQLLTKGIDKDKIYRNVFNNYSVWAIRLRGYLMSQKLNYFDEYHASYFTISRQDMRDYHYIKGDAEGLVNEPLRIKGLKLSISLREDDRKDNLVWVSLRSVDNFPCNEVASEFFNGGGHLNASGGKLACTMEEAEKIARQAILHYADKLKG
ncbi:MAG: DHH family phosphoesterase [Prevotella sp.]|jgi:phosphoesterase RecJ-like protein|nr:DHH family phosphoesterase [Prevotella sp.]MCI1282553.1 DHH family phosphoesterase [Prevotella sp.]